MYTYNTSDFNLAAYMLTKGGILAGVDKTNERRAIFEIQVEEDPEIYVKAFWANAVVGVFDFISAQQKVKKRLFSDSF